MKRRISSILLTIFLCAAAIQPAMAEEPAVAAQGAALIDAKTGRLLWDKNGSQPLAMASTTKIMTAILILERLDLDAEVVISKNAAHQPEVHMDLQEGERWRAGDLLSAMMLRSYNDAAVALAEQAAGSVEAFCAEMTKKAQEIGAQDTIFGSPNGLDSHLSPEQHHSTAYDMALIGAYAIENPEFCEIIAQQEIFVCDLDGKHPCNVTNADRFLREYSGALGIKTGYTNQAGHCFVGAARREDVTLVTAALGSGWGSAGKEKKWTDTKALMDYGFANYSMQEVLREGTTCGRVPVADSPVEEVGTVLSASYAALFSDEERRRLCVKVVLPQELEAPVRAGEAIGTAELWLDTDCLAEIPLLAGEDAPLFTLSQRLGRLYRGWLCWRSF